MPTERELLFSFSWPGEQAIMEWNTILCERGCSLTKMERRLLLICHRINSIVDEKSSTAGKHHRHSVNLQSERDFERNCWKANNSPNAWPVLFTLVIHLQWSVYRWMSERKEAPVSWSSLPHDRGHQQSVEPTQTILQEPDSQLLPCSVQRAEVEDNV